MLSVRVGKNINISPIFTNFMERLMKTLTKHSKSVLNLWTRFFGAILTVALTAPIAAATHSPASVNLGTAGDFVLLAKTGISVTGVASIVGNIGISPAAATYITGFGLIMDGSGEYATSSLVTGKIYSADYTDPTPTKMTTAVGDMETAYTSAAGRTEPDYTELYSGDITGRTLSAGLYKWGTGVTVSSGGVTISGTAHDVWIFQIAQNLELASGAIVTLSGGALASNIFWQVAGQVTLGTTAAMKGVILCQTAIVMSTGATLSGRGLAQTAITLDANTITKPSAAVATRIDATSSKVTSLQTFRNHSVEFTVPSDGTATLRIVNLFGQEIATLFSGVAQAGKRNRAQSNTRGLTQGLYFTKLEFNGTVTLMKMSFSAQ